MKEPGPINRDYIKTVVRERPGGIHKGDCGKVLVLAGSRGMAGAAVLCARSALRAGAGLVRVSVPEELYTILQISVPEATCVPRDLSTLDLKAHDAIALGPGLGDDPENGELIAALLERYNRTIVLDADGINAVSRYDLLAPLRKTAAGVIITPHYGEAARLLAYCGSGDIASMGRVQMAETLAGETGAVCVLKGQGTLVTTAGGLSCRNTTGNPGMAAGGSGDVLTGVIAALAGQGLDPVDAAKAGVFLHGLAGDLCAAALGETGMTSLDLSNQIAAAFKAVIGK